MDATYSGGPPPALFEPSLNSESLLVAAAILATLIVGYLFIRYAIWTIFTSAKDAVRILRNHVGPR